MCNVNEMEEISDVVERRKQLRTIENHRKIRVIRRSDNRNDRIFERFNQHLTEIYKMC